MNFMRLSSMKAAHVAVVWCREQEIRVKPWFWLEWDTTGLNAPFSFSNE
jgi:hypothetical protein